MTHPSPPHRLTPADWIMAGFRQISALGPAGLRIDAIAADLGVTKGSFYWHFKDLGALRAAMLSAWEDLATTRITASVAGSGRDARNKLVLLAAMVAIDPGPGLGGVGVEPAIRDWARSDPQARAAQDRVDRQRLADLTMLFAEADHPDPEGAARCFYAGVIGMAALRLTTGADMGSGMAALLDHLLYPVSAASKG